MFEACSCCGILYLYFEYYAATGVYSFNIFDLYNTVLPRSTQLWLFLGFSLAFAIKVPMFPFHTWLPDAHTEAPTVGSVLLAAVLLKMGTYGFLRFSLPLFPNAALDYGVWIFLTLALIGILYGAWVCIVQKDLNGECFSSVSHWVFVMRVYLHSSHSYEGRFLQISTMGSPRLLFLLSDDYERRIPV